MPSHQVHVKWSKILTGKARPEIDKFLDDFIKDIDDDLLRECIQECRRSILENKDSIENILDFYETSLDIEVSRYSIGYLLYTYLDEEDQLKIIKKKMRTHDSWRIFDPCIVLNYVERKYGRDALYITIVHIVLDEIARLVKISYTDAGKGIRLITNFITNIYPHDDVYELCERIKVYEYHIIRDVAFSIGVNIEYRRPIRHILLIQSNERDLENIKILNNLDIINIKDLTYEYSKKIYDDILEFQRKCHAKVNAYMNPITGKIHIAEKYMLIVNFRGHEVPIVFPHVITIYPVGGVKILVDEYLSDVVKMMRLGPMKDDLKGGR